MPVGQDADSTARLVGVIQYCCTTRVQFAFVSSQDLAPDVEGSRVAKNFPTETRRYRIRSVLLPSAPYFKLCICVVQTHVEGSSQAGLERRFLPAFTDNSSILSGMLRTWIRVPISVQVLPRSHRCPKALLQACEHWLLSGALPLKRASFPFYPACNSRPPWAT